MFTIIDLLLNSKNLIIDEKSKDFISGHWKYICKYWPPELVIKLSEVMLEKIPQHIKSCRKRFRDFPVKGAVPTLKEGGGGGGDGKQDQKYLQPTPLMREHGIGFAGYNEKGIPKYIIGLSSIYDIRIEGDIKNMSDQDIVSLWTQKNIDAFRKDQLKMTDNELQIMK